MVKGKSICTRSPPNIISIIIDIAMVIITRSNVAVNIIFIIIKNIKVYTLQKNCHIATVTFSNCRKKSCYK